VNHGERRGGCPVDHEGSKSDTRHGDAPRLYDVYGQPINPDNMMPGAAPNQLPSPGQESVLPTERQVSSIPKAAENSQEDHGKWLYPSEQMFYNALKRKGKAEGVTEQDMAAVVQIHNQMNERTWQLVMDWEKKYHCNECEDPRLLRFQGKPDTLSPVAAWRHYVLGYPKPFDRHDWVVDRCGVHVRYVIDYYHEDAINQGDSPNDTFIHVRPAVEGVTSLRDRISHVFQSAAERSKGIFNMERFRSESKSLPSVSLTADAPADDVEFRRLAALRTEDLSSISTNVRDRCRSRFEGIGICEGEQACQKAYVALNHCIASVVCPEKAEAFIRSIQQGTEADAYTQMTTCIDRFHAMARRVMMEKDPDQATPETMKTSSA